MVATLALLLTGCSIPNPFDRRESSSSTTSSAALPSGQEALATFYRQQLAWTDCDSAKCAKLTVPLDYAKPDGATIELSVLKVAARSSRKRIGSLLVNPEARGAAASNTPGMPISSSARPSGTPMTSWASTREESATPTRSSA